MAIDTLHNHHVLPQGWVTVFNTSDRSYYQLDVVAALVWKLIQQPLSFVEIRDAIMDAFEVEREYCERDLVDLLKQMEEAGLIEAAKDQRPLQRGLSSDPS